MKTKKQKLPSKKFLKELSEAQQKQHSESLREILNAADKAWKTVSGSDSKKRKSLLEHAKKLSKPAHTEVFEGYGVMKENGNLIGLSFEPLPFFSISEMDAKFLQWKTVVPTRVVKLRAEFKVI